MTARFRKPTSLPAKVTLLAFALVFGGVGCYLLFASFADAPTTPSVTQSMANGKDNVVKQYTLQLINDAQKLKKNPADQAALNDARSVAKARAQAITDLMAADPSAAVHQQFPSGLLANLPADIQGQIEQTVTITGKLQLLHGESIDPKTQQLTNPFYNYSLTDSNGHKSKLYIGGDQEAAEDYAGDTVTVQGAALADTVAVDSANSMTATTTAASTVPTTQKKIAVILVNFADNTAQPWTAAQAKAVIFGTTAPSLNTYYQEQSYGALSIAGGVSATGDVFGWYTLQDKSANCAIGTWTDTVASDAKAAATAAGANMANYDDVIYAFPHSNSTGCNGWAGLGVINGPGTWINGYLDTRTTAHEVGHNFGAHHANSYGCKDATGAAVSISSSCTSTEYGDPFDAMGGSLEGMNAFHRVQDNLVPGAIQQTVTASGTYTVNALENSSSGAQTIRIPIGSVNGFSSQYDYYVEFRQPTGYDSTAGGGSINANGVFIHLAPDSPTVRDQTQLIDTTPGTATFSDAALTAGSSFVDTTHGITIKTVSTSSTSASVSVQLGSAYHVPTCVRANPTTTVTPVSPWANPGDTVNYTVTIKNNDSADCGTSNFWSGGASLPSGLNITFPSSLVAIPPGATGTMTYGLTSSTSMAGGAYTVSTSVYNYGASTYTTPVTLGYNVYSSTDSTPPTVKLSTPTNGQTVNGNVVLTATANDNVGVARVNFSVDGSILATPTVSPYSATWNSASVTNGTHTISAVAYDAAGNASTPSTITVTSSNGDTTAPSTPTGLKATATAYNSVSLSWTASTDNVGVAGYYVVRNGATIAKTTTTGTSYVDTTVGGGASYTYQLMAYDAAGNTSAATAGVGVTTPAAPSAPSAPTGLAAVAVSGSQINLTWNASTGSPSSYNVYRNGAKIASVVTTSFGDTGLTANTSYNYYVTATNSTGTSAASVTVSAKTQTTTTGTGSIQGTIKNASGSVVSNATVAVATGNTTTYCLVNSAGVYQATNLAAGSYVLTVSAKKYVTQTANVTITSGAVTTQNTTLVATGNGRK